jgi:hypothetical protein
MGRSDVVAQCRASGFEALAPLLDRDLKTTLLRPAVGERISRGPQVGRRLRGTTFRFAKPGEFLVAPVRVLLYPDLYALDPLSQVLQPGFGVLVRPRHKGECHRDGRHAD